MVFFVCQAEDRIRYAQESRGLGDVYKRQEPAEVERLGRLIRRLDPYGHLLSVHNRTGDNPCLLYTSEDADDLLCVDRGGRRIIKKKSGYNGI